MALALPVPRIILPPAIQSALRKRALRPGAVVGGQEAVVPNPGSGVGSPAQALELAPETLARPAKAIGLLRSALWTPRQLSGGGFQPTLLTARTGEHDPRVEPCPINLDSEPPETVNVEATLGGAFVPPTGEDGLIR